MADRRARRIVVAPDKFRGSATARAITESVAAALRPLGADVIERPMSDGGEGLLDALGGEVRTTTVTGPLGAPVEATWRVIDHPARGRTAVIEMAEASGLSLAGGRAHNDPIAATTRGTGELVVAALEDGVRAIVIGCGGSATTDGGLGAVEAIGGPEVLAGIDCTVVCDVLTLFCDAAVVFGPQKGAEGDVIGLLTHRLEELAVTYRKRFGVDVTTIPRAGAAGGLAGGLAALGATLVSGFDYVADAVDLDAALEAADLVITGEGELDQTSFAGKVVGEIAERTPAGVPILLVVGAVAEGLDLAAALDQRTTLVSLVVHAGRTRAFAEASGLVGEIAAEYVRNHGGGDLEVDASR
jgi:glycerate 2-kinase